MNVRVIVEALTQMWVQVVCGRVTHRTDTPPHISRQKIYTTDNPRFNHLKDNCNVCQNVVIS
jgi:hypothetical protein